MPPVSPVPPASPAAHLCALRQAVLAVTVLDDIDLELRDTGVRVPDAPGPLVVTWTDLAAAVGAAAFDLDEARSRVRRELAVRVALAAVVAEESLAPSRLRLLGRPVGSEPDLGWAHTAVPGGAVSVGLGIRLGGPGADVVPVPSRTLASSGLARVRPVPWTVLEGHLEAMGTLAAAKLDRQPLALTPMGDSDVVTLLASAEFRRSLAQRCPTGMRAAVVASRRRGWLDPRRLDAAFSAVAYSLTDRADQAFERPLLVTADEVAQAPVGGRPAELDLRDPVRRL